MQPGDIIRLRKFWDHPMGQSVAGIEYKAPVGKVFVAVIVAMEDETTKPTDTAACGGLNDIGWFCAHQINARFGLKGALAAEFPAVVRGRTCPCWEVIPCIVS